MNARIIGDAMIDFNGIFYGIFHATGVADQRPLDDAVPLGQPAILSAAPAAVAALFRRRRAHAGGRRLSLAAAAVGPADAPRAPWSERIERRALHARARRESLRARHERAAPESAQLRQ